MKTVVITGAAQGLGQALAPLLARLDYEATGRLPLRRLREQRRCGEIDDGLMPPRSRRLI